MMQPVHYHEIYQSLIQAEPLLSRSGLWLFGSSLNDAEKNSSDIDIAVQPCDELIALAPDAVSPLRWLRYYLPGVLPALSLAGYPKPRKVDYLVSTNVPALLSRLMSPAIPLNPV